MNVVNLVLTAVSAAAGIIAAVVAWFAYRSARRVEDFGTERSFVAWEVYPLSDGTFDVGNIGHDPAYEVTVEAWTSSESAKVTADVVPPLPADGATVQVVLPEREEQGPEEPELPDPARRPVGVPIPQQTLRGLEQLRDRLIGQQVEVRVSWRSAQGRWSTWEDQTG